MSWSFEDNAISSTVIHHNVFQVMLSVSDAADADAMLMMLISWLLLQDEELHRQPSVVYMPILAY